MNRTKSSWIAKRCPTKSLVFRVKAVFNDVVVAEADDDQIIRIEGNSYFPPSAIKAELFTKTDLHTTCHWKGEASYYSLEVDGQKGENLAWYYPEPKEGSVETVGKDFANYVAFYPQVQVS